MFDKSHPMTRKYSTFGETTQPEQGLKLPSGVGEVPASSGGETPDKISSRITREQWQHYLTQFDPLERNLVGEVNSRDIIDKTQSNLYKQNELADQSIRRNLDRFGLKMNGAQHDALERQRILGQAAGNTQAMSDAFITQRDRNMELGGDLMQLGRGVAGQGISGMSQAAGMQANRNSQNAQAKAANSAQRNQMLGGAIGAGVTAAIGGAGIGGSLGAAALALI